MEQNEDEPKLVIDWMDVKPAPEAILELLSCNCSKKCEAAKCVCAASGLKCTDMCTLQECENQTSFLDEEENDENKEDNQSDEEY